MFDSRCETAVCFKLIEEVCGECFGGMARVGFVVPNKMDHGCADFVLIACKRGGFVSFNLSDVMLEVRWDAG